MKKVHRAVSFADIPDDLLSTDVFPHNLYVSSRRYRSLVPPEVARLWRHIMCNVPRAIRVMHIGGHMCILRWLHESNHPWCEGLCEVAAGEGHLDILRWAWAHFCPMDEIAVTETAARCGKLNVLVWAHEQGLTHCKLNNRVTQLIAFT